MEMITITPQMFWLVIAVALWSLPWKGYALWLSAKRGHKWWFIVLLLVNTLAILEIFYIFFVPRKRKDASTTK